MINQSIINIALELKSVFFDKAHFKDIIAIFLCGGSEPEQERFRRKIQENILKLKSNYKYYVYIPEDMFIEFILGHQRRDLLSLENLLAKWVNAVVIPLQSPGTFTEFGAFINFDLLKDKLIIICDPKFSKSRSFINQGPLDFLKRNTKSKILYTKINNENIDYLTKKIIINAREITKVTPQIKDLSNPIFAYDFYLAMIYIFDPIPKKVAIDIVKNITNTKEQDIVIAAETVLMHLLNERKIVFIDNKLSVTPKGCDYFLSKDILKNKFNIVESFLSEHRLKAINLTYRRKYGKVWGEVF